MTLRVTLAFALAMLAAPRLRAQGTQAPNNQSVRMAFESRVLSERRAIDVALPADYATDTTRRYPLVVVLDGDSEGELAAECSSGDCPGSTGLPRSWS